MRYVALGDLVVDCYYRLVGQNYQVIKIDGGSSRFNVIANLAARGVKTAVISGCGHSMAGDIALKSLKNLNVDVSDVVIKGSKTRAYHLIVEKNRHVSTKKSPITGKTTWYSNPIADEKYCLSKIMPDDVLILDGLKDENIPFLVKTKNEKVLDIGRTKRLLKLTNSEIIMAIKNNNIQILQLNESVEQYLMNRFCFCNMKDIFDFFNLKFLIVTRGKNGADFVSGNTIYHKELINCKKEIDDTGAGDAFFSMFIQRYYDNSKKVDEEFIDSTFSLANKLTAEVVSNIGARGHLYNGYY